MIIFPAIDLYEGKAVRLFKGDYGQKTVYSGDPLSVAQDFRACGAGHIHVVDLEGAKNGQTPNFELIKKIKAETGLFTEVGGGIRSIETAKKYADAGIDRLILGTSAVTDRAFLLEAVRLFGDRIAVGVDVKDGHVAIRGWTETSGLDAFAFCSDMEKIGVKNVICTDISRDGAMRGTNRELYAEMAKRFSLDITASGGVSDMDDVKALKKLGIYGAIIGKAYYTGSIRLKEAVEVAEC